jgi:hypothetical protein
VLFQQGLRGVAHFAVPSRIDIVPFLDLHLSENQSIADLQGKEELESVMIIAQR